MLDILNPVIYSELEFGSIIVPIKVHISKIMPKEYYIIERFEDNVGRFDTSADAFDKTSDFFYGKFKKVLQFKRLARIIHSFIDYESMKYANYLEWFPKEVDDFCDFVMDGGTETLATISDKYHQIVKIMEVVKTIFQSNAIKFLELDQEYPSKDVPSKDKVEKTKVYKRFKKYMTTPVTLGYSMSFMEYQGNTIFKENNGKTVEEYSWRELEFRRMFMKKKSSFENFNEKVRGAIMDEISPSVEE